MPSGTPHHSPHLHNNHGMVNGDFAVSPAFFPDNADDDLIKKLLRDVFPHFTSMTGMERILRMCLASLLYHRDEVQAFVPIHIARNGISIFRNINSIAGLVEKVKVIRAWESRDLVITGVPPHIKKLWICRRYERKAPSYQSQ
eukprot:scaffold6069_cov63-Attheya_sp.AAC.5